MVDDDSPIDDIKTVADRADFLDLLTDRRLPKRAIVEELDRSRSTVNRAIGRLRTAGLVEETADGCRTTLVGRLALEEYRRYVDRSADVLAAEKALSVLPPEADVPLHAVAGGQVYSAGGNRPYEPFERAYAVLEEGSTLRACLRTVSNRRTLEVLRESAEQNRRIEIVFSAALFRRLYTDWRDLIEALVDSDSFSGYVTDDPVPFAVLLSSRKADGTAPNAEVAIVTYTDDNELGGVIVNDEPSAVVWGRKQYRRCREAARPFRAVLSESG